jgi:hypothetical protein
MPKFREKYDSLRLARDNEQLKPKAKSKPGSLGVLPPPPEPWVPPSMRDAS